jgi:hypothetical protein
MPTMPYQGQAGCTECTLMMRKTIGDLMHHGDDENDRIPCKSLNKIRIPHHNSKMILNKREEVRIPCVSRKKQV